MPPGSGAGAAGAGPTGAGGGEPADAAIDPGASVRCAACDRALVVSRVTIGYMGSAFDVDLQRCPSCGQVYIPEAIALGKMADVEQQLEDK